MRLALAGLAAAASALMGCATAQTPGYHVTGRIALTDGGWDYASIDPALHRLYLARTDAVTAVDLDTGKVTGKLAPAGRSHEVLPLANGAVLMVTNGATGQARFIDARTGAEIAVVPVGKGPDAAIFDPASGLVVVVNHAGGTVTLVDPAAHGVVAEITVGGTLEFAALDGKGKLFVNDEDASEMAVLDLAGRKVVTRIKLGDCEGPTGLAYLPAARRLLAACGNDVAAIVDPELMAFERSLPAGTGADAVIYDRVRRLAFVPAGESGDLTIFADEAGGVRKTGRITTQVGARTGAVDEKTGHVFLPAALYDPPITPGGRPQIRPGSVVVLEISP